MGARPVVLKPSSGPRRTGTSRTAARGRRPFHSELYRVINLSPNAVLVATETGQISALNTTALEIFGYQESELLGRPIEILVPERLRAVHRSHRHDYATAPRPRPMGSGLELVGRRRDGSEFPIEVSLRPMMRRGRTYVLSVVRDLTAVKMQENQLRAALHEQDVLLKELHHRVKNNMQIISSLMNLQKRSVQDAQARAALEESRRRIHAMALIHEILYKSTRVSSIELGSYITRLVREIAQSFAGASDHVRWNLELDIVSTNVNLAVNLGLIVNELVSNCLKHAFRGRQNGMVTIRLKWYTRKRVVLTVADNGIGLPPAAARSEGQSLGLQLIRNLAVRLPARLRVAGSAAGTSFRVEFEPGDETES